MLGLDRTDHRIATVAKEPGFPFEMQLECVVRMVQAAKVGKGLYVPLPAGLNIARRELVQAPGGG
jgi:hypothetical protein